MCHTVKTGECDCRYLWDAAGGARASACVLTRTIKGAGASPSIVHSSIWRDRLSALGNGEAQSSEGTVYISTRVVEMREFGGAITFIAVSEISQLEAILLREELERSTQLLR